MDLKPVLGAVLEQFRRRVELVGRSRALSGRIGLFSRLDDESTAHAVVFLVRKRRALCIASGKLHSVGMPRQHLVVVEHQLRGFIEGNLALAAQSQPPLLADSLDGRLDLRRINGLGPHSFQPQ